MPREKEKRPPEEIQEYLKSPPESRHRFSALRRGMKEKFEVRTDQGRSGKSTRSRVKWS